MRSNTCFKWFKNMSRGNLSILTSTVRYDREAVLHRREVSGGNAGTLPRNVVLAVTLRQPNSWNCETPALSRLHITLIPMALWELSARGAFIGICGSLGTTAG